MNFEKPALKTPFAYIKLSICAILVVSGLLFTLWSVKLAFHFREVAANPLNIQAHITHVESNLDSEYGNSYDAMMEYRHGGTVYTDAYKNFTSESDARQLVGSTVTIQVDPKSPEDGFDDISWRALNKLLFAFPCFMLAALLCFVRHRRTYVETYGWRCETAKLDIIHNLYGQIKFTAGMLLPLVMGCTVVCCYPDVFQIPFFISVVTFTFGGMFLLAEVSVIRRLRFVCQNRFYMRKDIFISKRISTDLDGNDTYHVTYGSSTGTWETSVMSDVYDTVDEGDFVESVFLEGEKKPILSYSRTDKTF